jgi:CheY-like chemotaxis protein
MRRDGPILILEDNFLIAWDLYETLSAAGFAVLEPSGDNGAALRLIAEKRPAFAFLDYNLGGQTSLATARALEALRIPFVYLSGQAHAIHEDPRAPKRTVLSKPLAPQALVAALAAA